MAVLKNTFEGGSNGVTLTTGNTGGASGDAVHAIAGNVTFDNTRSAHGTYSSKLSPTSGVAANIKYGAQSGGSMLASTSLAARFYVYFTANPSTEYTLLRVDDSVNGTRLRFNFNTAGKLLVMTHDGTTLTTRWTSTQSVPLNQWVRLEIKGVFASGTGGSVDAAFYAADSGTAIDSFGVTGINTGANLAQSVQFGKYGTDTTATAFWIDDIAVDSATTSFIGPVGNAIPIVSAGSVQNVAAASTVNLSASASDPDGSIAAYAWTFDFPSSGAPSLTGASTATPSFTSGSAGSLYILRCTVTDSGGATAYSTVEIRVPVAGATTMRHLAVNGSGVGTWTLAGGAATDGAALSDETDTTYIESPTLTGTEATRRVRLQPSAPKASAQLKERLWTDSGTANATIRLIEGTTTRQTWTQALTTSPAEFTFAFSGGTISAIGDWGNLYVEVGVTT